MCIRDRSRKTAPARASNAHASKASRARPPRWASPSPSRIASPRSMRRASRASPVALTISARRAERTPSSSPGWRAWRASETTRLITESPRNSRRSLWPGASSGCSWSQLPWTRARSSRLGSPNAIPRRAANAAADRDAGGSSPRKGRARSAGVLVDVVEGVLHGTDLLGFLVRDLDPELLLEAHDELDEVERVRVQIVDERGLGQDLRLVDAELLDNDLPVSYTHLTLPTIL